jgi:hypothetical protein
VLLSVGGQDYYYDQGVYYEPSASGYTVIAAPTGAAISQLPGGYETITLGDAVFYYWGGVFYVEENGSYKVIPAPEGAIITHLPEGASEQQINGITYLLYNGTYYLPISQNGRDAYQVVQMQER